MQAGGQHVPKSASHPCTCRKQACPHQAVASKYRRMRGPPPLPLIRLLFAHVACVKSSPKSCLCAVEIRQERLTLEEQCRAEAPAPLQSSAASFHASEIQPTPAVASTTRPDRPLPPRPIRLVMATCCPHSLAASEVVTPTACRFDPSIFEGILDRPGRQIVSLG
jgi:hypothetical protein